jgi:hypothetical protein
VNGLFCLVDNLDRRNISVINLWDEREEQLALGIRLKLVEGLDRLVIRTRFSEEVEVSQ